MNHSMEILCVVWWEKLAATHPDDLFPSEQQALERHVASCQACAAVRAEYQTIDALLLAGEDLEPLPVLSTQLLQPRKGPAHVPTMSELPRTMRLSALAGPRPAWTAPRTTWRRPLHISGMQFITSS